LDSRVKEIVCFTDRLVQNYKVEDSATCVIRFENGAQGIVDNFFNIPDASSKNRLEIYGSGGSLLAEGTIGQSAYGEMTAYLEKGKKGYDAGQKRQSSTQGEVKVSPINMYRGEIEEFSKCIEKDLEPAISGEEGLWSQKVVLACYQSARTGKVVQLKG
jgi:predicted dehydrogenase